MRRRRYLTKIGAGLSIGITGLAGCGAPGEEEGTPAEEATPAAEGTPTEEGTPAEEESPTEGEQTATETTAGTAGGQDIPNNIQMITEGSEYIFDPVGLFVEQGEEITWINDSGSHSSTAYTEDNPQSEVRRIPEGADGWNSEILSEGGAEFSYTFEETGTYDYYCIPHKSLGMVARIVVGEPSGLEGDPPDGPVPSEQKIVEQGVVTQEEFNP